jgi:hypothetical protein
MAREQSGVVMIRTATLRLAFLAAVLVESNSKTD